LQRHLLAKYIQQSKCFDEYHYTTQPITKLPKIVSVGFPIFLKRVIKHGKNAKTAVCQL